MIEKEKIIIIIIKRIWSGKKQDEVYVYNGILLSHREEWNTAICSNMDGPREYYA